MGHVTSDNAVGPRVRHPNTHSRSTVARYQCVARITVTSSSRNAESCHFAIFHWDSGSVRQNLRRWVRRSGCVTAGVHVAKMEPACSAQHAAHARTSRSNGRGATTVRPLLPTRAGLCRELFRMGNQVMFAQCSWICSSVQVYPDG